MLHIHLKLNRIFNGILVASLFLSLLFFQSTSFAYYYLRLELKDNPPGTLFDRIQSFEGCVGLYNGNTNYISCGTDFPLSYDTKGKSLQDIKMWVAVAPKESGITIIMDPSSCNTNAYGFVATVDAEGSNGGWITMNFSRPGTLDPQGKWESLFLTVTLRQPGVGPIYVAYCHFSATAN